jgi:hypothetical protein
MEQPANFKNATRCGAKTRSGEPCKSPAIHGGKRCRMHGGKSLRWFAHPNYEHGLYSKYDPFAAAWRAKQKIRRERIKEIRKMSEGELRAKAARLFGKSSLKDWNAEEFRAALLAFYSGDSK